MKILPSDNSYSTFCELTGGYRMFFVLREALRIGVIDRVAEGGFTPQRLVERCALKIDEGLRFVELLINIGLLEQYGGELYLSRFSATYLAAAGPNNQRHVLEFEELLMENWDRLGRVLVEGQGALTGERPHADYMRRQTLFQQAMGEAARVRREELWDLFPALPERGLIVDIGAGDGSYLKSFLERHPGWEGVACDLPDVCAVADTEPAIQNLSRRPINILDSGELDTMVEQLRGAVSILLVSNLIHCYSAAENRTLLKRLAELPDKQGLLVLHDFFRDGNDFGALYDLHMLVNTWNGRCYSLSEGGDLLREAGFVHQSVLELPSRSYAVVASRTETCAEVSSLYPLRVKARQLGFYAAADLDPAGIKSEPWVKAKCVYGCSEFGRRWSCPPNSMGNNEFRELLGCYSRALLLAGQPPLRSFQEHLLDLEKEAFLGGFTKALAFTGGPCCWCDRCPDDRCSHPEKRRPSLESCGVDVFALAASAGIKVAPLKNSDDFVQYIGLLLVD